MQWQAPPKQRQRSPICGMGPIPELATVVALADRRGPSPRPCEEIVPMGRIIMFATVAASMAAMLALAGAAWAQGASRFVDPPPQVDRLRERFEGLTAEQIAAQGYAP